MKFADRIQRLGTETAFAVSSEAAAWAAQGHKVYPFYTWATSISLRRST